MHCDFYRTDSKIFWCSRPLEKSKCKWQMVKRKEKKMVPVHQARKPFIPRSDLIFWLVVVGVAGSARCKGRYWHCSEIDCCTLQALQPEAMNKKHSLSFIWFILQMPLSRANRCSKSRWNVPIQCLPWVVTIAGRDNVGDLKNRNWKILKVLILKLLRTKSWCESVSLM